MPWEKELFRDNLERLDVAFPNKELLNQNRTELKVSMRSKWYKSNAPALQMALMKLICTDEERKKLAMQYSENLSNHTIENFNIKDIITFKENVSDKWEV